VVQGWEMGRPSLVAIVGKLAIAGEQAGFTIEQMIQLLNAGLSVDDLVQLIAQRLDDMTRKSIAASRNSSRWIM